jgi:NDP-sugar pyrophosphorylase family protein
MLISQTAEIDPTAVLGPNVVIGPGAKIGPGARLQRCVVLSNAVIRDHSWIANSIIGWNSNVGRWVSGPFCERLRDSRLTVGRLEWRTSRFLVTT